MKNPCDFVKFVKEGNLAIPYCTYGSYSNNNTGFERIFKVRIFEKGHPCPFLEECPHQGQTIRLPEIGRS